MSKWYMVFYVFNDRYGTLIHGRVPCCTKRLDGSAFDFWQKGIAEINNVPDVAITNVLPMDGE